MYKVNRRRRTILFCLCFQRFRFAAIVVILRKKAGTIISQSKLHTDKDIKEHVINARRRTYMYMCCFALFVCLPLLASFFLPSLISH